MSFSIKFQVSRKAFAFSLFGVLFAGLSNAAPVLKTFGDAYTALPAVSGDQAQVVYYRLGTPGQKGGAANIYVDDELHSSLLPGGYTTLCVAPGQHKMAVIRNDEVGFSGSVDFEGGKTLFLRLSENGKDMPQVVPRETAEKELAGDLRQVHVFSRASAVSACKVGVGK
jgi:OOP family OmpA-OmpF porin